MSADFIDTTIGDQLLLQRGFDITKKQQEPGNIPVVSSGGAASYHNKAMVSGPGVVLGRKGSLGTVFYIEGDFWPHDTTLWVKDFKGNNPRYVYYFFKSIADTLKKMDVGAANPALNRNHVHPLPVKWPENEVQEYIVKILGTFDDKIELNRQINQTLEQIAQAIFKSWFVDFDPVKAKIEAKQNGRDPERAAMCVISGKTDDELDQLPPDQREKLATTAALFPDELMDSEMGLIPNGWSAKPLYETATFINGAAFKSKQFSQAGEGIPIVKIAELKSGITAQTKFTKGNFPKKYLIGNNEVLYSWSGSPNTSLEVFKWFGGKGWLNQHIFKVVADSEKEKYFVFFLLRHLKPTLIAIATDKQTTGLGHVTVADMKRLHVPYPNENVLLSFGETIRPLYEKNSLLTQQSQTLAELRDTLLPKLLSGEIELDQTT